MNKTAIKNFAIWARVQLIEAAKQRAYEYEITENGENRSGLDMVGGRLLTKTEKEQRNQLISEINRKGYSQVMEEAAYTWFNRFIALRFMEVNGYLPFKVRVFTDENGTFKPEILKQAMSVELEGLDRSKILDLLDRQDNEELYKYLLIAQCNALNTGLPYMFETIGGWTELLFPANLLRQDSVIGQMISEISEEDWTDAVQIIGWLYQYYNSELKDETFALLKKNVKITKERIPAATQLFTPDWIVRYMVENSLGRLWYEGHPDLDKSQWKYYLDEAEQEPEVEVQLQKIRTDYSKIQPEEIKLIDPCMGSGHILVYAFDVLMQIYTSVGWSERDAAKSILENNLYGLDIDDRAGQLAYFAVMMKARKHSRRILNGEVKPNVLSIQDSNWMTDEFISYVAGKDANMKADLVMLRKTFRDAKEYGSILNVPTMQYDALYERIDNISRSYAEDLFQTQYKLIAVEQLLPLVKQSQIMSQKYDVVVTNPPYMGGTGMSSKLDSFIKNHYDRAKTDLYSVFIERCHELLNKNGYQAMITQHGWMFLSSFEKLRTYMLHYSISSMAHLGARAFDEIGGEVVQSVAFVIRNTTMISSYRGQYVQLIEYAGEADKEAHFFDEDKRFVSDQRSYSRIAGSPIAYWSSSNVIKSFEEAPPLSDIAEPRQGVKTLNNELFLKLWFEVDYDNISFNSRTIEDSVLSGKKWFPYNKGGTYRKWFGNNDYLVNWFNDGFDMKKLAIEKYQSVTRTITNISYFFKPGLTWSSLSSGNISLRAFDIGYIFDSKGSSMFFGDEGQKYYVLALINSKVSMKFLEFLAPTLDFNIGPLSKIPVRLDKKKYNEVDPLVKDNIKLSKEDWDSFETSWDFKKHPLI